MIAAVVALNCLLAALIFRLALNLWRWRRAIAQLTDTLQSHEITINLGPKQASYALAQRRMQMVETQLHLAIWHKRLRQIQQLIKLVRGLQMLLLLRSGKTSFRHIDRLHKQTPDQ